MNLERVILKGLLENENFCRAVLPYIKDEYFHNPSERIVFQTARNYILKYNTSPSLTELTLDVETQPNLNQNTFTECKKVLVDLGSNAVNTQYQWLMDNTEKFCRERAIYNAMVTAMQILEGKEKTLAPNSIPDLLSEALAITFNPHIGHSYLDDFEEQYEYYHQPETRIPFDLEILNNITGGGIPLATLTVLLAGVHVGKTLTMGHLAAGFLTQGKNVLYITLEMGEKEIVKRIDANLLNISIQELDKLPKDQYLNLANVVRSKTNGKLVVHEFPTATANAAHFKALIGDLKLKKGFHPDVVFIDYINLCTSVRYKAGGAGMYEYVQSIAQELRGLAGLMKTRVITATQVNREGFKSADPDMTNTAESFGLPAVADFMLALVATEQLKAMNQLLMIQLKNRFGDVNTNTRFTVGIDRPKMRLFDINTSTQGVSVPLASRTISAGFSSDKFKDIKV